MVGSGNRDGGVQGGCCPCCSWHWCTARLVLVSLAAWCGSAVVLIHVFVTCSGQQMGLSQEPFALSNTWLPGVAARYVVGLSQLRARGVAVVLASGERGASTRFGEAISSIPLIASLAAALAAVLPLMLPLLLPALSGEARPIDEAELMLPLPYLGKVGGAAGELMGKVLVEVAAVAVAFIHGLGWGSWVVTNAKLTLPGTGNDITGVSVFTWSRPDGRRGESGCGAHGEVKRLESEPTDPGQFGERAAGRESLPT